MSELIFEIKEHYDNHYKTVFTGPLDDQGLSWKAKGIFMYLRTRPPGWQVRTSDLEKRSTDGPDAVRSGLKELERSGYLYREQIRNEEGRFLKVIYHLYDEPARNAHNENLPLFSKEELKSELPQMENTVSANPTPYNTIVLTENKDHPTISDKARDISASKDKKMAGCILSKSKIVAKCMLMEMHVQPHTASDLVEEIDLDTIVETINSMKELTGLINPAGFLVNRLNNIISERKKSKERDKQDRIKLKQDLIEHSDKEKELNKIKAKNIDGYSMYLKSNPGAHFLDYIKKTQGSVEGKSQWLRL